MCRHTQLRAWSSPKIMEVLSVRPSRGGPEWRAYIGAPWEAAPSVVGIEALAIAGAGRAAW